MQLVFKVQLVYKVQPAQALLVPLGQPAPQAYKEQQVRVLTEPRELLVQELPAPLAYKAPRVLLA